MFIVAASLSTVALFTICVVTAVTTSALLIKIRHFSKSKRDRKSMFINKNYHCSMFTADNGIIKYC